MDEFSNGRFGATEFTFNNLGFYGMGGTYQTNFNDFYEYDPVSGVWTSIPSISGFSRKSSGTFSIGSAGYVYGGNFLNGLLSNELWELSNVSAINDVAQVSSVVYNSTTSHLMVNTHLSKPTILKIYDIKGKWIQSFSIRSGQQNVMLSLRLDPSVYLYQFNNGVTGKLVVQY